RRLLSRAFFLFCAGAHRRLQSFPTRRSSDLVQAFDRVQNASPETVACSKARGTPPMPSCDLAVRVAANPARIGLVGLDSWFWLRSEEHASELQSRGHLVCRLLLDKNNVLRPL